MSLARLVTPSASMTSTSRMIGRWLASSALAAASSSSASSSLTSKSPLMPSRSRLTTSSPRYISSIRWRIVAGEPSSIRTSRPVANASIFSASMSNGLAVATSRNESVWRTGTTLNRRATCSGTLCWSFGSSRARSAMEKRNRPAIAFRIWSSAMSFRWTRISQSDPGAEAGS